MSAGFLLIESLFSGAGVDSGSMHEDSAIADIPHPDVSQCNGSGKAVLSR